MSRVRLLVLAVGWVGLLSGACSSPPEQSNHLAQGVSLTDGQKKLVPVLECVRPIPQGFAAQFGYENTSGVAQDLVVGANNGFGLPEPEDDQGQLIRFAPGRQRNVFQVPFVTSLTWTLGQATATATATSAPCGSSLPPPRESFAFHVPQGVALESIVVGQEENLLLQSDSRVLPATANFFTTAFGTTTLQSRVQLGSLVGKGAVTIGKSSVVAGNLRSETQPQRLSGAVVKGTTTVGPVVANKVSFGVEKRLGGGGYVGVTSAKPVTLPPGSYGNVEVLSNGALTLQAGRYYFEYFRIAATGTVTVLPGGGSTTIMVDHVFKAPGKFTQPEAAKGRVLVLVGSQADAAEAVVGGEFSAMLVAPYTDAQVLAKGKVTGGIFSNALLVGASATINFRPFEWAGLLGDLTDTDGDTIDDRHDACVLNPTKSAPLLCGCAKTEADSDGDGTPDCLDACPHDPNNTLPGACGCSNEKSLQPAGTPCVVEACSASRQEATCDAQGQCGVPNCAPVAGGICTYKTFRDSLYWFCSGAKTWDEANSLCNAEPGRALAKVDDRIENLWISGVSKLPTWLGGNARTNPDEWNWATNGAPPGVPFWVHGLPVPGRFENWSAERPQFEACIALAPDGSWSDAPCTETRGFVCEQPLRHLGPSLPPLDKCKFFPGVGCGEKPRMLPDESTCVEPAVAQLPNSPAEMRDAAAACISGCPVEGAPGCAAACSGFAAPPPKGQQCDAFSAEEQALCDVVSPDPVARCSPENPVCPPGLTCGRRTECAALDAALKPLRCSVQADCPNGQPCSSALGLCIDPTSHEVCDYKDGDHCVGICSTSFACGQIDPLCASKKDGANVLRCSDTLLCSDPAPPINTDPRTDPQSNLTPQIFTPDTYFPKPVEAPSEYTPAKPPGCGGPGEPACVFEGGTHPWCKYRVAAEEKPPPRLVSDKDPAFGDKKGSSGSLGPISFDFDPNLELTHDVEPLPFGDAKFKVGAQASASAAVGFNLFGVKGKVTILDALARLEMDRCGLVADAHLLLLGKDFLPTIIGEDAAKQLQDADTSPEARKKCEVGVAEFSRLVNRAQKALRDAQELMRQEKELVASGKRLSPDLCQKLIGDGKGLPPNFPSEAAPFTGCDQLSPEDTINLFVRYYKREVGRLITGQATLLRDATPAFPELAISFGQGVHKESTQVGHFQFFVGPIPMDLTIDVYMQFGVTGALTFSLTPLALIDSYFNGEAASIADVDASFTPSASSGVTVFLGAGFDFGAVSAKVGLSGDVSLGEVQVPVYAGAGLRVQPEVDARALPGDLTDKISTAELIFPPGIPKKYRLDAYYKIGASAIIDKVLQGELDARLRIKFAFFSKTWSKRIAKFDSPFHIDPITLIGNGGSLAFAADFSPLASIRMPLPFVDFEELQTPPPLPALPSPPPPGSGGSTGAGGATGSGGSTSSGGGSSNTGGRPPVSLQVSGDPRYVNFSSAQAGQLFYDGYCECSAAGQSCGSKSECCGGNLCVLDDSLATPAKSCAACVKQTSTSVGKGQQCTQTSECCQGDPQGRPVLCYQLSILGGPNYCQACRGQDEPMANPAGNGSECCAGLTKFIGPGSEANIPVCSSKRLLGQSCNQAFECASVTGRTVECSPNKVCALVAIIR